MKKTFFIMGIIMMMVSIAVPLHAQKKSQATEKEYYCQMTTFSVPRSATLTFGKIFRRENVEVYYLAARKITIKAKDTTYGKPEMIIIEKALVAYLAGKDETDVNIDEFFIKLRHPIFIEVLSLTYKNGMWIKAPKGTPKDKIHLVIFNFGKEESWRSKSIKSLPGAEDTPPNLSDGDGNSPPNDE